MPDETVIQTKCQPNAPSPTTRRFEAILLALLLGITALNFARAMNYAFLEHWDDGIFILENRHIGWSWKNLQRYATQPFQDLYTPLPMYSLMADYALFGLRSPLPYHLHNLLLHLGCAALLYWIARRLKLSPTWAFFVALLWSINPQKSESVVWITERKDVQCGILAFAAFLAFLHELEATSHARQLAWGVICVLLTALAIFAKPAAAPLVGIYVVYALMTRKWRPDQLVPVLGGLGAVAWSMHVTAKTNPGVLSLAPTTLLHNLFWYPLTAVLPIFRTSPIYPNIGPAREYWLLFLLGTLTLAGTIWYALRIRHLPWTQVLGGFLLLGGTMLPVIGLWLYTNFDYCDRYNYLVSAVALLALAKLMPECRTTRIVAALLALLMAVATQVNLSVWKDTQTFWRTLIARHERVNPKVFEVAANDALIRDDDADLDYVVGLIRFHAADLVNPARGIYGLAKPQVDNTILLLSSHAFLLREEHAEFLRLMTPLMLLEAQTGEVPTFMRSPNYPKIYRRNAKFARLLQHLPLQPQTIQP